MQRFNKLRFFAGLALLMDFLAVITSVITTYVFRFYLGLIPLEGSPPDISDYIQTLIVVVPVYLWVFRSFGLYSVRLQKKRVEEIFLVIKAVSLSIVLLMAVTFFYREQTYSRIYIIVLWFFSILYVSFGRYLIIQYKYYRKFQQKDIHQVLIVGTNHNAAAIIDWAKSNPHFGRQILGLLTYDASEVGKKITDVPVLGTAHQCEKMIEEYKPQEVILLDPGMPREQIADLVALCEDQLIDFKIGADLYGLMSRNVDVEYVSSIPLLGFNELPLDDPWSRAVKRTFDLVVSFFMLILSAPIWLFAAFIIKLQDGGPVFFIQERMGRDQRIFNVLKFRTMRIDAEEASGPVWAKENDQRRTQIGTFLRKWNIDELPQLLNVLAGDMSLVGPRPERPHFIDQFRNQIPRYMTRHKIKSGLTGWAQVNGYRGNTSIEERIKYDLYYMENWSILFDLEILFMTLFAFKNAY